MDKLKKFFKILFAGLLVGLISGMFASGGGLLLIPIFVKYFGLSEKEARGTALFCILPMVIVAGFFYHSHNYIDYKIGLLCAIGGTLGGFIGATILKKINIKYLKILFSLFLLYIGIKILFFT